ncbi:MAG: ATP-binding protein [candidate division WOR-3 bacterium]|jgi:AAA+ superfamily predicted ATPase
MHRIISEYLEVQNRLLFAQVMTKSSRLNGGRGLRQLIETWCFMMEGNGENQVEGQKGVSSQMPGVKDGLSLIGNLFQLEQALERIMEKARAEQVTIPLEKMCVELNLPPAAKTILLVLFFARLRCEAIKGVDLLLLVSDNIGELIENTRLLAPDGLLLSNGLIERREKPGLFFEDGDDIFGSRYEITDEAFWRVCGQDNPWRTEVAEGEKKPQKQLAIVRLKEPEVNFEQLVLSEQVKKRIEVALWQYEHLGPAFESYGLAGKIPYGTGTTMLFYGPPGTGKTATAEAIARQLGRKLGYVQYDQLYSKWFGDSEKRIRQVFEEAKEADCVLVFDEADACFGHRLEEVHSTERGYNLITNILMQEIERYRGLVILTTNRDFALDRAFERRILLKLEFSVPGTEEREMIWRQLLGECSRLGPDVSFAVLAQRYQLTGGNIKNAVIKAVTAAAREDRAITMADLELAAKEELGRYRDKAIGF